MDGRSLVRAVVIDQYMHTIVTVDQVGRPTSNPASAQPTLQRLGDMSAARAVAVAAGRAHTSPRASSPWMPDVWADSPAQVPRVIRGEWLVTLTRQRLTWLLYAATVAWASFVYLQGSEFTASRFRAAFQRIGIRQTMGRPGSALDNAIIESWHSAVEFELRRLEHFTTRAEVPRRGSGPDRGLQPDPTPLGAGDELTDRLRTAPPLGRSMTRTPIRQHGTVLAGVKALRPFGRPAAGLDPGCGRCNQQGSGAGPQRTPGAPGRRGTEAARQHPQCV